MKQLVQSWVCAERAYHGNSLAAAIRRMNELRGTAFTHSRVSEWRRGVYVPAPLTLSAMLVRTLPWALGAAGIDADEAQLQRLEALLWRQVEKDGRRYLNLL